jgi:serine/threonine protein kinase/WD40 repeat protein
MLGGVNMPAGEENIGGSADPPRQVHEDVTVVPSLHAGSGSAQAAAGETSGPGGFSDLREFSRALIEIGLADEADLESYAADSAEGVLGLSRALVSAGKLTAYQAAAIYQKKSRGLLIGNYVILDKLGQGGMGVVFKARHRRLGRVGALKILPPSFARDHQAVMRFRREVEAAGRLKHPNVVAAVDADEDRGVHFLVMEYVEGRDLDRVVGERGPMPVAQAIDCMIQAARGLEAAHAEGIVHRDIKPANLMVDAAGTVRVLDLGLARLVDAANPFGKAAGARLTESGMYMGTIDFMAPEQAEDSHRVDHRADIYSLGCTLFYLLNGRAPFDGATVLKRLMAHMERPAPSLRTQRPEVPASLEAIYQKMMAKSPADRPASMTELISLLESSKADAKAIAPTAVAPKSKPELKVFNEAPQKRATPPKTDREPSIFARPKEDEGLAIDHDLNLEDLIMDVRSEPKPEPMLRATKTMTGRAQPLKRPGQPTHVRRMPRNGGFIALVASIVVLVAGLTWFVMTRGENRPIEVSEVGGSGEPEERGPTEKPTDTKKPAAFEDEFHTIFDEKSTTGWILSDKDKKPLPPSHIQKDGLNPHLTGSYLVVYHEKLSDFELDFDYKLEKGCHSGVFLRVSDLTDPIRTGIEIALADTTGSGFNDSGAFAGLVAPEVNAQKPAGQPNHMTITAQGPEIHVVLNGSPVSSIRLDEWTTPGKRPDGSDHDFKKVAVASLARTGYVGFKGVMGNCWFNRVRLKKLSPGGVSSPGTIARKDTSNPISLRAAAVEPYVETARFVGHGDPVVQSVHALPDGKRLLSTSNDGTARLWDVDTGREIRRFRHPAGLRPAALLPDGRRAITGCGDGVVRLWDLDSGGLIRSLVQHSGAVWSVAVSRDGTHALSGGEDKTLRILDIARGGEVRQFEGISTTVMSVAFSPDGRRVLAGGQNGAVYLGDMMTSDPLRVLTGHTNWVWDIAFTSDNRHAVSSGADGRLIYWDLDAKRALHQTKLDDFQIRCLALEANGRQVIFGAQRDNAHNRTTGVIGDWDMTTDGPSRTFAGGRSHLGLASMPHGAVATSDFDGLVRTWEPSAAIAKARELATAGKRAAALPEYDKAVANRPADARLLIERGRLLASLGDGARAESDFQNAARLAPDSPQLFLDAGWWVAGPYPPDFSQAGALENGSATDPSQPAPPSGNTTFRWHDIAPGMRGAVNFEDQFKGDDIIGYAMTVVYAAGPREAVLLLGNDDAARIRVNGRVVFFSAAYSNPDSQAFFASLQAGRNTIVVKVRNLKQAHGFSLRFGESPSEVARAYLHANKWKEATEAFSKAMALDPENWDRETLTNWAQALAEAGRWQEAKGAFEKIAELDPENFAKQYDLSRCYFALTDRDAYERLCRKALARYGKTTEPALANNVIWLFALMPNVVRNYTEVVDIGRKLVNHRNPDANNCSTFGSVLYRAGQYAAALTYLKRSMDAPDANRNVYDWLFTAMARHKSKQPGDREALATAKSLAEKTPAPTWQHRLERKSLFDEAEKELSLSPPR